MCPILPASFKTSQVYVAAFFDETMMRIEFVVSAGRPAALPRGSRVS